MRKNLVGIINCTPDSFYDGGLYHLQEKAIEKALTLQSEGADILDIGGESSRPNAKYVSESDEMQRVLPLIKELKQKCSIPLSIDTYKVSVAQQAVLMGVDWVNDITGGIDPAMRELVSKSNVMFCCMHMNGTPQTMQFNIDSQQDIIKELLDFFSKRIDLLLKSGLKASQIVLDPGIGFGKTVEQNIRILSHLTTLKTLGFPIYVGISRKSFLTKFLQKPARELLAATIAVNALIFEHVDYFRVHDVKEHRQMIDLLSQINLN